MINLNAMANYQKRKEAARQEAIDWQNKAAELQLSMEGVAIATVYFKKLGKRYGLLREFRENGII